jgi:hypothetical protein
MQRVSEANSDQPTVACSFVDASMLYTRRLALLCSAAAGGARSPRRVEQTHGEISRQEPSRNEAEERAGSAARPSPFARQMCQRCASSAPASGQDSLGHGVPPGGTPRDALYKESEILGGPTKNDTQILRGTLLHQRRRANVPRQAVRRFVLSGSTCGIGGWPHPTAYHTSQFT